VSLFVCHGWFVMSQSVRCVQPVATQSRTKGFRCEAAGTGGPLILEYQKSATTHTDYLAGILGMLAV
jgi:hypothetical protein